MRGRPKKTDDERKDNILRIRLTDEDRQLLDDAALISEQETSTWARDELLSLARKKLQGKKQK